MFSRNKNKKEGKKREPAERRHNLAQFGLSDFPGPDGLGHDGDGGESDDADLEAELLALTNGKKSRTKPSKASKEMVSPEDLNKMVSDCMRDDIDRDLSDGEDPDLLNELAAYLSNDDEDDKMPSSATNSSISSSSASQALSPVRPVPVIAPRPVVAGYSVVALLEERILMYNEAEEAAIAAGESSRAHRFGRGLKTLNQMLKTVKSGKPINEDEIPPSVLIKSSRRGSAISLNKDTTQTPSAVPSSDNIVNSTITHDVAFRGLSAKSNTPSESAITQVIIPGETKHAQPISSSPPTVPTNPTLQFVTKASPSAPFDPPQQPSPALAVILDRQNQYKTAALAAKRNGDKETALRYLRVTKQLDPFIEASKNGNDVDLSSLPPPPPTSGGNNASSVQSPSVARGTDNAHPAVAGDSSGVTPAPAPAPASPLSVVEALQQMMGKYVEQRDKAKREENSRKQRMNDRIIKQYQEAIKLHKLGRHVEFDELPIPPGFSPISALNTAAKPAAAVPVLPNAEAVDKTSGSPQSTPSRVDRPAPPAPVNAAASASAPAALPEASADAPPVAPPRKKHPPVNVRTAPKSRVERQLSLLTTRKAQFREAALEAKKKGEIEQAKEYLRNSKGFDQLILAAQGGLPIDMNTVPIPPQEAALNFSTSLGFEIVNKDDCGNPTPSVIPADIALSCKKLEDELIEQIKMCARTREHFKALGDVASCSRFEQLILHTKKDLDAVRVAFKRGDKEPRFHYETRTFTMIQSNTDLTDSDLEVTIVRGINFNVANPKEVDTYVKIEFPYPTDAPPEGKTDIVKDTNCPEFNHKVVFSIDRKSRGLVRVFKRHSVKCQVFSKGSFFHRDAAIGSVKAPLVGLENQCTIHESYDLMDDKKKMVGGKLEVKLRIRNPILTKQLEKVTEKWLVIDGF